MIFVVANAWRVCPCKLCDPIFYGNMSDGVEKGMECEAACRAEKKGVLGRMSN